MIITSLYGFITNNTNNLNFKQMINKTMKVKIMQRSVFYKYAEIEIKVSEGNDVEQFLLDNEDIWSNKIENAIKKAKYKIGKGMNSYEWTNKEEDSERMYLSPNIGGHI